jgi:hypothetical protein
MVELKQLKEVLPTILNHSNYISDKETRCISSDRKEIPRTMAKGENLGDGLSTCRRRCFYVGNAEKISQVLWVYGVSLYEWISSSGSCFFNLKN